MGLERYVVDAVVLERRNPGELARTHGISRSWIYELVARYRTGGPAWLNSTAFLISLLSAFVPALIYGRRRRGEPLIVLRTGGCIVGALVVAAVILFTANGGAKVCFGGQV